MENQREKRENIILKHERFPHGIIIRTDNLDYEAVEYIMNVVNKILDLGCMYTKQEQELVVQFMHSYSSTGNPELIQAEYVSFVFVIEQTLIEIGITLELVESSESSESKKEGRILC